MAQAASKRRISVGVLFWIAFILLVLVIFLANRTNIEQILDSTGLVDVVRDRFSPEQTDVDPDAVTSGAGSESTTTDGDDGRTATDQTTDPSRRVLFEEPATTPDAALDTSAENALPPAVEKRIETPAVTSQQTQPVNEPIAQRAPSPDPTKPNRLMADLFFIRVNSDGRVFPQRVTRPVYYDSSPLTETINALIAGPRGDELEDGLLNLIPNGTELLSAHVQNGVAYLNFNRAFRFNQMGAEGTVAQLVQIVYSSTEFPTVDRVQILIEGETLEYLSGEGVYVGEPLGRDSFG